MFRKITMIDKNILTNASIANPEEVVGDLVIVDVPLFIRLLEYAREDASNDVDLHFVAQKIIGMLIEENNEPLTMEDYNEIVGKETVLTEKSLKYRMDSRTLWSRFAWSLLNYSIALNSEIDGKEQAEARIYSHADRLGQFVLPYYGSENALALAAALTKFAKIGVKVMQDLKAGIPLNGTKELWDASVAEISGFLSALNPEAWPAPAVKSYFDTLISLWIDSIAARDVKNWAANEIAMDSIDKLVTTGDTNLVSLADVFSEGVISHHPNMFKD